MAIPPLPALYFSESFLLFPPLRLILGLNIMWRTVTESSLRNKRLNNIFSLSGNQPCECGGVGVSFPFESLPGKHISVCQAVSCQAGWHVQRKAEGPPVQFAVPRFDPCQNSKEHNRHSLHPWGDNQLSQSCWRWVLRLLTFMCYV